MGSKVGVLGVLGAVSDKCFEQVVKFVFRNQEQLRLQEEKNEEERSKVGLEYLFYTSTFV